MDTSKSLSSQISEMKEGKYFAVEYAGFWNIQEGQHYGDTNILDAEKVGEEKAEQNAKLIVQLLNGHATFQQIESNAGIRLSHGVCAKCFGTGFLSGMLGEQTTEPCDCCKVIIIESLPVSPSKPTSEGDQLSIDELLSEFKGQGIDTTNWDGDEGAAKAIVDGVKTLIAQLREGDVEDGWVKDKPVNDKEFVMVTATWLHKEWNYTLWEVIKITVDDKYYYGLCNEDGDEWGDYDDLTADLYKIIPNPPKQ